MRGVPGPPRPLPPEPPRGTCRVVQRQTVVEHICCLHAVGVVPKRRDAVVPAGQGAQGLGPTSPRKGGRGVGSLLGAGDTAGTQAEPAQLLGALQAGG